jgi:hypothetical protein
MSIDTARNQACKTALEYEFDYVLMIDDDVMIPFNAYGTLIAADKDIVAGWTIIRGYPYNNMHFISDGKDGLIHYNDHEQTEGVLDCDAVGCSLTLIKCSLLKKIPPPYFVTGTTNTEDIYFCVKARKYVPECSIAVDLSVKTAHILTDQIVTPGNKAIWKKHEEEEDPNLLKPVILDHTESYIEENGLI